MARRLNLTCHCFGFLYRERVGWATQIRDGPLLVMALLVLAQGASASPVVTLAQRLPDPPATAAFVPGAVGLALSLWIAAPHAARPYRRPAP